MLNARAQIVLLAAVTLVMSLLGVSPGVPDVPAEASAGAPRNVAVPGPVEPVSLAPSAGQFVALQPFAVSVGTIATGGTKSVPVAGVGGVAPAGQVSAIAVVLNGRATTTTGAVTAFEEGTSRPSDTSLRIGTHGQSSSYDVIPVSSTGKVSIYASQAATVGMHVRGYYTSDQATTAGSTFVSTSRTMVLNEARTGGSSKNVTLSGISGIPAAANVEAVALEVTAQSAAAAGYVRVFQYGASAPPGATLWVPAAGSPRSGFETTQVSAGGSITVYTSVNATITVRLRGYYLAADATTTVGTRYRPVRPATAISGVSLAAGGTEATVLAGQYGVPAASTVGNVAVHAAALSPGANGLYTLYASGSTRSTDRSLMYTDGVHDQAYDLVPLSPGGSTTLYSSQAATAWMRVVGYTLKATVPGAPGNVFAAAGDGTAQLNWTKPADDGGSAITGYRISQEPGGKSYTVGNTTSAQITELENGTRYVFNVRAINAVGVSPESAPTQPETPNPPPGPSRPFITEVLPRDEGAAITWLPPSSGAGAITGYRLEATPGGQTWSVGNDTTSAKIDGLANGTRYRFRLFAINANGEGESPLSSPVVPQPADVPMAPPITSVTPGDRAIQVQWVEPLDGGAPILHYEVQALPGGTVLTVPVTQSGAVLEGLTNGTMYAVSVRAVNKAGRGPQRTAEDIVPVASRAPSPPRDVAVSAQAPGEVGLSWKLPVDAGSASVDNYRVVVSPAGGQVALTGTTAVVSGLDAATAYTFSVQAKNTAGWSDSSKPTLPIKPNLVVKSPVTQLTDQSMERLRQVHSSGALDFIDPPTQVRGLKVGDLILLPRSAAAPDSYLGRVTKAGPNSGMFVVETERASLADAFSKRAFSSTESFDTGDDLEFTPTMPGVRLLESKNRSLHRQSGASIPGVKFSFKDGKVTVALETTMSSISIAGTLVVEPDISYRTQVDGGSADSLGRFNVKIASDISAKLMAGVEDKELFKKKIGEFTKWRSCGYVCAYAIKYRLYLAASYTVGAGVEVKAFVQRDIGVEIGETNGDASGSATDGAEKENNVSLKMFGKAGLSVGFVQEISVFLYGVLGPTAEISTLLVASGDTTADPWATLSLKLTVKAYLDFSALTLPIMFEAELLEKQKVIWDSGGPFFGLVVTPEQVHVEMGREVDFEARPQPAGNPAVRWRVVSGPGIIDEQDGKYAPVGDGTSVVEAYDPIGLYQPGRGVARTGDFPPGTPRAVTAQSRPFSLRVNWQPPADAATVPIDKYVVRAVKAGLPGGTNWIHTQEVDSGSTTAMIGGLEAGSAYLVSVAALNEIGLGEFSEAALGTPRDAVIRIGSASNVAVDERGIPGEVASSSVALSGNGRYVAYAVRGTSSLAPSEVSGSPHAYLVRQDLETGERILASRRADGATPEPIVFGGCTCDGGQEADAAISADGDTVVYGSLDDYPSRLHLQVRRISSGIGWRAAVPRVGDSTILMSVFMSGDGATLGIAVLDSQVGSQERRLLRVMASSPTVFDDVYTCPTGSDCTYHGPSMSADGSRFAYVRMVHEASGTIQTARLYDAHASPQTITVAGNGDSSGPAYSVISGDGESVAVTVWSETSRRIELWVVKNGLVTYRFHDPNDAPMALAFDHLGNWLVYSVTFPAEMRNHHGVQTGQSTGVGEPQQLVKGQLSDSGGIFSWAAPYSCVDGACDWGVFVQRFFATE